MLYFGRVLNACFFMVLMGLVVMRELEVFWFMVQDPICKLMTETLELLLEAPHGSH